MNKNFDLDDKLDQYINQNFTSPSSLSDYYFLIDQKNFAWAFVRKDLNEAIEKGENLFVASAISHEPEIVSTFSFDEMDPAFSKACEHQNHYALHTCLELYGKESSLDSNIGYSIHHDKLHNAIESGDLMTVLLLCSYFKDTVLDQSPLDLAESQIEKCTRELRDVDKERKDYFLARHLATYKVENARAILSVLQAFKTKHWTIKIAKESLQGKTAPVDKELEHLCPQVAE